MKPVVAAGMIAALVSWWGTRAFLRYALARGVVDVPNARSSHAVPTPRGGGVAIVAATLAALLALAASGLVPAGRLVAIGGSGIVIAGVGYADDHRPLAPAWRFLAHVVAGVWLLWWLGAGSLPVTDAVLGLGYAGDVLALLYVVWLVNLTNFMDGIDGIAGVEAITAAIGGCVLLALGDAPTGEWGVPVAFAGACAGFLAWNWPPARIFMGDVGSGFLGVVLAALSLRAGQLSMPMFWGWLILLGVFVTDATWTLLRRLLRGERVYEAHRSHAYQHAAARAGSHRPVTLAVLALNLLWLLPIAVLTARAVVPPAVGMAIAYLPLVGLAARYGAGAPPLGAKPRASATDGTDGISH